MPSHLHRKFIPLLFIASVAGCGGGGGGSAPTPVTANAPSSASTPSTTDPAAANTPPTVSSPAVDPLPANNPPVVTPPIVIVPPPVVTPPVVIVPPPVVNPLNPMTMSCVDGATYQCSGGDIIQSDNDVALTSSGVQAYSKSTSDLTNPITDPTTASGFALASGGVAEIRLAKDGNGTISGPALLLKNLGLSWNGTTERPQIIETFMPTQGRVQLDANGALAFGAVADSSNLGFYDFAIKGINGTQANYANNRYFPRIEPVRCPSGLTCASIETTGLQYQAGNWRVGGGTPDRAMANRTHNDGDVHAGNGQPDANGNVTILPGGNGVGVPFPGTKGLRDLVNWSLQYANLAAWYTQDTINIGDWGATNEHNKKRRGIVAFGDVSNPASVPATGSATYSGYAYGWYAGSAGGEPLRFEGAALVTVNFVTRQVIVTIQNTVTKDGLATPVPVTLTATTTMGVAGSNAANYLTGPVDNGTLKGGLSGRYFGPVVTSGTSGAGPAEIGGALSLSNAITGQAVVGGFVARKQ